MGHLRTVHDGIHHAPSLEKLKREVLVPRDTKNFVQC